MIDPTGAHRFAQSPVPKPILCESGRTDDRDRPRFESWSPFCVKVHRGLRSARLPYVRRHGASPASFRKLNPTGQVPVLVVDGEPISDSSRILRFVDDAAGGRLTAGLDADGAAAAWLWEDYADRALNGYVVAARWFDPDNWPRTKGAFFSDAPGPIRGLVAGHVRRGVLRDLVARDVTRAGAGQLEADLVAVLDGLDRRAPGDGSFFLGTSTPTVADLGLFAQLQSLRSWLTPKQRSLVEERPRLVGWLDRVEAATRLPDGETDAGWRPRGTTPARAQAA